MAKSRTKRINTGYSEEYMRRRIYYLVRYLLMNDMPISKVRDLCRAASFLAGAEESGNREAQTLPEQAITEALVKELLDG